MNQTCKQEKELDLVKQTERKSLFKQKPSGLNVRPEFDYDKNDATKSYRNTNS